MRRADEATRRWCRRGVAVLALSAVVAASGCDDDALNPLGPDAGAPPAGLTPQQAAQVLAKVGDTTITLGDFAMAIERLNPFDRIRFQSKQRRRELLQELIDLELLAQEARRRGLDKKPAVQEAIRQILRDALHERVRQGVPGPGTIPATEVQAYYQEHLDTFREPERRRVSAIVMTEAAKATKVLAEATADAKGKRWGALFQKNSLTAPAKRDNRDPADLAGDLGLVGPPGDAKGDNRSIPEPLRKAVFELQRIGQVYDRLVEYDGRYYVVRLSGRAAGHTRTLAEADREIRVAILQQRLREREAQLEADLRKRFKVVIDQQALGSIRLPGSAGTAASASARPAAPVSGSAAAPSRSAARGAAPSSHPSSFPSAP